jgi:hypothetical protein
MGTMSVAFMGRYFVLALPVTAIFIGRGCNRSKDMLVPGS